MIDQAAMIERVMLNLVGKFVVGPELQQPKRLADGTLGHFVRWPREDDCFTAAIATVLQVPIGEVPDPNIDQRLQAGERPEAISLSCWNELTSWLTAQDLRIVVHREVPAARKRWIGVVPFLGDFNDHSLVMSYDKILFDPYPTEEDVGLAPNGRRVRTYQPDEVQYGFSFQSIPRTHLRRKNR